MREIVLSKGSLRATVLLAVSVVVGSAGVLRADQVRVGEGNVSIGSGDVLTITADTTIRGSLTNDGLIDLKGGMLTVKGTSRGSGRILSSFAGRDGGGFTILGDYVLGPGATLNIGTGTLRVGGDVDIAINDYNRFIMNKGTLQLIGLSTDAGQPQDVEMMAGDAGQCGITLPSTAHWSINKFRVGPTATTARLVDNHDNDALNGSPEVLYVGTLQIDAGATLNLNGKKIYYSTLIQSGGATLILNGGSLVQLGGGTPVINTPPSNASVCSPAQAQFTVSASGSGTLTYQWRLGGSPLADGGNISGATTATLTINPTSSGDAGSYDVVVTNACGSTTSSPATLSVSDPVSVDAGGNQSMCTSEGSYNLGNASASNYSSLLWTSGGDGSFDNDAAQNPTYTPGSNDLSNGSVTLTLTAYGNSPCGDDSSDMTLSIVQSVSVDAGGNQSMCSSDSSFQFSNASASNYSSLLWSTDGDGSFDNDAALNPTYTPGSGDISNGSVTLTLTAYGNSPCGDDSNPMTLTITAAPTVSAGSDDSTCTDFGPYSLNGATASDYTSLQWTTDGDGSFDDDTALNPAYTPGSGDLSGGTVHLTLTAGGNAPCNSTESFMILTIVQESLPNTGGDRTMCDSDGSIFLGGATADVNNGVLWSNTSGDGSFDDATLINPTYTPGPADITNGSVSITMTAYGYTPCADAVDSMILTINTSPAIISQSGPTTGVVGFPTVLTVSVNAVPAATYQWRKDSLDLVDGPRISGSQTDTLTIDPTEGADDGTYDVVITNDCGTITSDPIVLTVEPPQAGLVLVFANGLRAPEDCVQPGSGTNEILTVRINMYSSNAPVTGGQFFLTYDNTKLDFLTATPGLAPFTRQVFKSFNEAGGELTYATGIPDNGSPTQADSTMAILTFRALSGDCATTSLVRFSDGSEDLPPTRLSGINDAQVTPNPLVDLSAITMDYVNPTINGLTISSGNVDASCQYTSTFSATVSDNCGINAADVNVALSLSSNATMGAPSITITQTNAQTVSISGSVLVSAVENCPAVLQINVDAVDQCGNAATPGQAQANINDTTAPVISTVTVNGGNVDNTCQYTVSFTASVSDNCFVDSADVSVAVTLTTGNAILGAPTITKTQTNGQTVSISGSVQVSAVENCPATVRVTVNATDDCSNAATPGVGQADVRDNTAPVVSGLVVTGSSTTGGTCETNVTFSATVTDNCFVDSADTTVTITLLTANATLGSPTINKVQVNGQTVTLSGTIPVTSISSCPVTVRVTIGASDDCSNAATPVSGEASVNDGTAPVISGLTATGGFVDSMCQRTVTFSATVTDNCTVLEGDVNAAITLTTGNATLGAPSVTKTQVNAQTVTISGSVLVSALTSCPATVRVTITAVDGYCGNTATPAITTADVRDNIAPNLTVPGNISVHSDAGECQVTFSTLPMATATDNCDTSLNIVFARSDSQPNLLDPYQAANSPIFITWTATDDCLNSTTGTQRIDVSGSNVLVTSVELSPTMDDPDAGSVPEGDTLTRCIRFELWSCPAGTVPAATVDQVITFPVDAGFPALAANAPVLVPCGVYNCITARDRLHTLRSRAPDTTDAGTTYTATFVGNRAASGHWLIGGNLNDDRFIDILDFGSFVIRFQTYYGTGNTNCSTPFFHADITGDGLVFTGDFTFIQVNFLQRHESNCCNRPGVTTDGSNDLTWQQAIEQNRLGNRPTAPAGETGEDDLDQPITSISVSDLWRLGLGDLAAADLNGDGMLDEADMTAFAAGNMPAGSPTGAGNMQPLGQPQQRLGSNRLQSQQ